MIEHDVNYVHLAGNRHSPQVEYFYKVGDLNDPRVKFD